MLTRLIYWCGVFGFRVTQHPHFLMLVRSHLIGLELRRAFQDYDMKTIPLDLFFYYLINGRYQMRNMAYAFSKKLLASLRKVADFLEAEPYEIAQKLREHPRWKDMDREESIMVKSGILLFFYKN